MTRTEYPNSGGGRWIPWLFAGFFVVIAGVNAIMIWCAAASWTGLVTPTAYDNGLTYNRNLAAAARQTALGWQGRFSARLLAGHDGEAVFELMDRDGNPLADAEVSADFERSAKEAIDFTLALRPQAPGLYRAAMTLPAVGLWTVHLTARRGGDLYIADARVILR